MFYQKAILCKFFLYFISFRPQRKLKKISALIRSFVVEKPLISNGTLRTNCTLYAKWTNIYGHQKSNIFSNDASRCCFESSNVREGNCVLSRGFIIPSVRELLFFSCVIIIAKSCLMAAWYFYLFMDRWSPGIKVMIYSKGINHALITSTRDGQWHWESLTVLYLNDVSYLCEQNSWIITTCGAFPFRSEKLNQSLMIALADIKWNLHG